MTDVPALLYESFPVANFGGNITGVVLLEHPAFQSWMQGVAADLGAPTTGFVDLPSARQGCAEVRFFTPRQEIDACGHVTVAACRSIWHASGQDVRLRCWRSRRRPGRRAGTARHATVRRPGTAAAASSWTASGTRAGCRAGHL